MVLGNNLKSRTRSACTKQLCIFHEWALMTPQLYLIQFALVKEIFIHTPLVTRLLASPCVRVGWSDKKEVSPFKCQRPMSRCRGDTHYIPLLDLRADIWQPVQDDEIRRNDQSSQGGLPHQYNTDKKGVAINKVFIRLAENILSLVATS